MIDYLNFSLVCLSVSCRIMSKGWHIKKKISPARSCYSPAYISQMIDLPNS